MIEVRFESLNIQIDEYFEILIKNIEKLKRKLLSSKYLNSKNGFKMTNQLLRNSSIGTLTHRRHNDLFWFQFHDASDNY